VLHETNNTNWCVYKHKKHQYCIQKKAYQCVIIVKAIMFSYLCMHRCRLHKNTLVHFTYARTDKKTFARPLLFSYMEHPLKPPLRKSGGCSRGFLEKFIQSYNTKTSTKTFTTRWFLYSELPGHQLFTIYNQLQPL
jgi:hypothetical protein